MMIEIVLSRDELTLHGLGLSMWRSSRQESFIIQGVASRSSNLITIRG